MQTVESIRRQLIKKGLLLKKQAVLNLVKNRIYTGKLLVKPIYDSEKVQVVDGHHQAIITADLFNRVQE